MTGISLYFVIALIALPLATHRVTQFITRDKFPPMADPREAFVTRWGVYLDAKDKRISINGKRTNYVMRSLAYLWECDWCTSVWVASALTALSYHWLGTMVWVMAALAASDVTGLIADKQHD